VSTNFPNVNKGLQPFYSPTHYGPSALTLRNHVIRANNYGPLQIGLLTSWGYITRRVFLSFLVICQHIYLHHPTYIRLFPILTLSKTVSNEEKSLLINHSPYLGLLTSYSLLAQVSSLILPYWNHCTIGYSLP